MKLSVVGYPRIGTLRELKFASEAYFKHAIEQTELKQTAIDYVRHIGKRSWNMVLNLFHPMIFRFMIQHWIPQYF